MRLTNFIFVVDLMLAGYGAICMTLPSWPQTAAPAAPSPHWQETSCRRACRFDGGVLRSRLTHCRCRNGAGLSMAVAMGGLQ